MCACCRSLGGEATSRGVERGRSVVILGFVDCQFFCCILILPLLVAIDFGRCFVILVGVIFGQESKCQSFTDLSSVDRFGLKAQACRYFDKLYFFGLTDDTVSLWVFAWDDRSVECGVLYCRWNDGDVP